ncbi:MAG: DinB family protein [candidate division NC10 bacterium]|nr:DinB family protein [candidate division NC10 bacterium]
MHTPGDLHPALRVSWNFAEEIRAKLLESIHSLTAAQWLFRPGARAWCIGEQVEHLLLAEVGSSKMARKLIRGDFSPREVPVGTRLYTAALDRYPFGRLEAPSVLLPGPARNREILERALAEAHARFRSELSTFQGDDPEALRAPDPATGAWFTLGGWVKLQAWHEAHHLAQIQRIAAAAAFPR